MAKVNKRSEQRREQRRWDGILRRERLSMDRGRPNQLTYVDPSDLDALPDEASNPEDILLAVEKVKPFVKPPCPFTSVWVSHSHLRNGVYEACND